MPSKSNSQSREFDVVLYGASGFVGRQTVAYFAHHGQGLRWALAGRNRAKLEDVRAASGPGAAGAGLVVADGHDSAALEGLAARSRVVLSTAGPFAIFGSPLVAACVEQGTHYVDITGETPWVRGLIDRHHAAAAAGGTRIIPGCGFDSVPSDLGAWLAAQALWRQFGEPCVSVKASFVMRGGLNGGTLASALNMMDQGQAKAFAQPFLLNPAGSAPADAGTARHADPIAPHRDSDFGDSGTWLGPFVMGPINTRVVRRSVALLRANGGIGAKAYAPDFAYQEYMRFGSGPVAAMAAASFSFGMASAQGAMLFKPVRSLARAVAPGAGRGPSERAMDGGSFRCELVGRTASGKRARVTLADKGDPGNRATTKMVCESALALALQAGDLPGAPGLGGLLTPASGLGDVLAERLKAVGMTITVSTQE